METDRGLAASQLLISHLCHELVSPIGAINNGVELVEELGGDGIEQEALALIAESGRVAAARLRFYRVAYGSAGTSSDFGMRQARAAAVDLFAGDNRVSVNWPESGSVDLPAGGSQLVANLVPLAAGALPRGGEVVVSTTETGSALVVTLTARGTGARLTEDVRGAIAGNPRSLDHNTIHGWYCSRLAQRLGIALQVVDQPDAISVACNIPLADQ
jgi:histidine phosphotransferase ChpT